LKVTLKTDEINAISIMVQLTNPGDTIEIDEGIMTLKDKNGVTYMSMERIMNPPNIHWRPVIHYTLKQG